MTIDPTSVGIPWCVWVSGVGYFLVGAIAFIALSYSIFGNSERIDFTHVALFFAVSMAISFAVDPRFRFPTGASDNSVVEFVCSRSIFDASAGTALNRLIEGGHLTLGIILMTGVPANALLGIEPPGYISLLPIPGSSLWTLFGHDLLHQYFDAPSDRSEGSDVIRECVINRIEYSKEEVEDQFWQTWPTVIELNGIQTVVLHLPKSDANLGRVFTIFDSNCACGRKCGEKFTAIELIASPGDSIAHAEDLEAPFARWAITTPCGHANLISDGAGKWVNFGFGPDAVIELR